MIENGKFGVTYRYLLVENTNRECERGESSNVKLSGRHFIVSCMCICERFSPLRFSIQFHNLVLTTCTHRERIEQKCVQPKVAIKMNKNKEKQKEHKCRLLWNEKEHKQ